MRSSLLLLSLLALAGCSAVSEQDEANTSSADLVAPFWTQAEAASSIVFSHYASGDVPAGSACVPGTSSFVVSTFGARTIYVTECAGVPARTRFRNVAITDVEYTAIIGAARSVALSEKNTCDAGADFMAMGVYPREPGAFPSLFAQTDSIGCGWGQRASGIEDVLGVIEPIVAAAPVPTPTVYLGPTPAPGTKIWTEGARLSLTQGGEGETPHGSTCARGATEYVVTVENGAFQNVLITKCAPLDASSDRLVMRTDVSRPLKAAEKSRLTSALSQLRVSYSARCSSDAQYEVLLVTAKDASGVDQSVFYKSADNACAIASDYAPFVDLTPLRAALSELGTH